MQNLTQEPITTGLESIENHISRLVPFLEHPNAIEVATLLPSDTIRRETIADFLSSSLTVLLSSISSDFRSNNQALLGASYGNIWIDRPSSPREIHEAERLSKWAKVSPALSRVLRRYIPDPVIEVSDKVVLARRSTVFVPSKWQ